MLLNETLTTLKRTLDEHGILLTFSGPLSQEIIEVLGEAVKKHIISDESIKSNTLNIFSIFIEQTQNIKNYLARPKFANESQEFHNSGMLIIGKDSRNYFICSGNMSEKNDAKILADRVNEINAMDKEQKKAAYKTQLKQKRTLVDGEPGGAGLGLLEIARKASAPIEYSIINKNDRFDYIIFNVCI